MSRGWKKRQALFNHVPSGLTVLVGALTAYLASGGLNVDLLDPFAAGHISCIASDDRLPELRVPLALPTNLVVTGRLALPLRGLYALTSAEI